MPLDIAESDIGGARIRMGFTRGNVRMKAGEHLTADEVRSIPLPNRRALTSAGYIEVYPVRTEVVRREQTIKQDRFIVQVSKGQFNVIEGHRLNDAPLSREEAEALAK
jgi:hypothetical protein